MSTYTAAEVAEKMRCSRRKVTDLATEHSIGGNLGGSAGFRFTDADVEALWKVLRPRPMVARRKRRRSA